jgi:metallophosphoesterase superfamily enzyme
VAAARGRLRRRCFLSDDARCIMPAFGAYAGGLNILDAAFTPLFTRARATAHVLGRANVYRIGLESCRPD